MTEAEWLVSADPRLMLRFLGKTGSTRKFRLFALACCRRLWHLLSDERSRSALERAERLADQPSADPAEWRSVKLQAWSAEAELHGGTDLLRDRAAAAVNEGVSYFGEVEDLFTLAASTSFRAADTLAERGFGPAFDAERVAQAGLVRDIFGNPFRPNAIDSTWLTPTVTGIASAAYVNRIMPSGELDPARLAVVADALEEAGCSELEILDHLRGPGPHTRGCFVVDAILRKS